MLQFIQTSWHHYSVPPLHIMEHYHTPWYVWLHITHQCLYRAHVRNPYNEAFTTIMGFWLCTHEMHTNMFMTCCRHWILALKNRRDHITLTELYVQLLGTPYLVKQFYELMYIQICTWAHPNNWKSSSIFFCTLQSKPTTLQPLLGVVPLYLHL